MYKMIITDGIYDLNMIYSEEYGTLKKEYYTIKVCFKSDVNHAQVIDFITKCCEKHNMFVINIGSQEPNNDYYLMVKSKSMSSLIDFIVSLPNKKTLNMFVAHITDTTRNGAYHIGFRNGKLIEAADNEKHLKAFKELYIPSTEKVFSELKKAGIINTSIPTCKIREYLENNSNSLPSKNKSTESNNCKVKLCLARDYYSYINIDMLKSDRKIGSYFESCGFDVEYVDGHIFIGHSLERLCFDEAVKCFIKIIKSNSIILDELIVDVNDSDYYTGDIFEYSSNKVIGIKNIKNKECIETIHLCKDDIITAIKLIGDCSTANIKNYIHNDLKLLKEIKYGK